MIYEFMYIWIHIWNKDMNSWVYEFMHMNTNIIYRFWIHVWIHKNMNSDIRIHCIQSEFMNLTSLLWIHNMNSLLKITENSIFWIHNIESFTSNILHSMNSFCYEFIYELNIYEFINLISWENLWFRTKSTQQQFNTINLNTCKAM